jgi:hypothetical protein
MTLSSNSRFSKGRNYFAICYQKEETISHLFMDCNRANRIWFGSYLGIKFNPNHMSFIDWLFYCLATLKEQELCYIAAITYGIWFARNKMVFENHELEDRVIINMATTTIQDYQKAMNTMQNKDYKVRDHKNNNNHDNTGRSTNRRKEETSYDILDKIGNKKQHKINNICSSLIIG